MKPSFKYAAICRHRERYSVKEMCCFFEVSSSGYYKYLKQLKYPAKDFELTKKDSSEAGNSQENVWLFLCMSTNPGAVHITDGTLAI